MNTAAPGSPAPEADHARSTECGILPIGRIAIALVLLATAAVYARSAWFDFVNFDDNFFVYANPVVTGGLSWQGLHWGLTTSYYDFWHPLTWWSHMLDVQLFGLHPGGHHLVNVALHLANVFLLFVLLNRATGHWRRSAVVAGLFALHPMHVESVVWISERKDVLSAFFWLVTAWAYVRFAQCRSRNEPRTWIFYGAALAAFVLALMAKSMAVTLPCVLLLLDFWPLNRFAGRADKSTDAQSSRARVFSPAALLLEKAPFFLLAAASCVITYRGMAAGGNVLTAARLSWGERLANVPVAYANYLWKLFFPAKLAVSYPLPDHLEPTTIIAATILLVLVSVVASVRIRTAPWFLIGWLVFLGVLVPVIGIVAMSQQQIADRYTYLPSIGFFIILVWGGSAIGRRLGQLNLPSATAIAALAVCTALTWRQVGFWRNSVELWTHCLAVTDRNAIAHDNLGKALQAAGDLAGAKEQYALALKIDPDFTDAYNSLGVACAAGGEFREATNWFGQALRVSPGYRSAQLNYVRSLVDLADASAKAGQWAEARSVGQKAEKNAETLGAMELLEASRAVLRRVETEQK